MKAVALSSEKMGRSVKLKTQLRTVLRLLNAAVPAFCTVTILCYLHEVYNMNNETWPFVSVGIFHF